MNPLQKAAWLGALLVLTSSGGSARAAWDNVFQVCCHHCGSSPVVSSYSAYMAATTTDPCNPCPQQVCTTRYVQRCYYQPVTSYQSRSYYEPVTSYQTSYYYEPVCSYRYSCYYDPCTCSYQQVATPVTSYRLRSQCNAVQSYVQRCCMVPVTSYQQAYYWEPQTTCCSTTVGAPIPATGALVPQPQPQPGVTEQRQPAAPGVQEIPGTGSGTQQQYYPPQQQTPMPPVATPGSSSLRQVPPRTAPRLGTPVTPPPNVKLDRIVSLPGARVEGQVVRLNHQPWSNVRLTFVSAERPASGPQVVTANGTGKFQVSLASGGWLVYVPGADGKPALHSKIDVRDNETRQVTLVSR